MEKQEDGAAEMIPIKIAVRVVLPKGQFPRSTGTPYSRRVVQGSPRRTIIIRHVEGK